MANTTFPRLSPLICIAEGLRNPAPINTLSYPSLKRSSIVIVRPIVVWVLTLIPLSSRCLYWKSSKTLSGRRKEGIPYLITPPILSLASNIVISYPQRARRTAIVRPAGPEPTMATLFPFFGAGPFTILFAYVVEI